MRRLHSLLVVTALIAAVPIAGASPAVSAAVAAPENGLVLHYSMETLSQGTITDTSPSSLDGQVVAGSGTVRLVTGLAGYGRALQLAGTQHQFVDVPSSTVLDLDTYTLSAWVRYTGIPNDQTLGRWEVLEKAGAYWMNVRTNGLVRVGGFYGGCASASWTYFDSTRALPVDRWKHVATTYDGTWLRIYIDGRAAGAKRVSGRTCISGEPLAVGAKNNPTKGLLEAFWDGRLDEVRVYDRALDATEIGQLASRS
ncbi:LamG domain-containing protein [Nocardioides sp. URHA0032]|uniref:LamG domain-containing protein n=1 Tax=Nocardioides sp. URHA0032 TaxID=1380388 RepID=UPI0018CBF605|nr:LamG domain-containing protein [Nocardioides sp. URHA0032]